MPVLAEKTYNNIRSRLVTFLLWTESPEGGLVPPGYFPTTLLNILEEPECLKETCSSADLKKLFDVTTNRHEKSGLSLAKNAGVRSCEIVRAKKKFICWDEKLIRFPEFDVDGTRITKTGKPRSIPMNARLM